MLSINSKLISEALPFISHKYRTVSVVEMTLLLKRTIDMFNDFVIELNQCDEFKTCSKKHLWFLYIHVN